MCRSYSNLFHSRIVHSRAWSSSRHTLALEKPPQPVGTCRIEWLVDTHPVYAPSSYISAPQTHAHSWTGTETTLRPKAQTWKGKVAHKALHCSREIRALLAQPRWRAWVFLCQVLGPRPRGFSHSHGVRMHHTSAHCSYSRDDHQTDLQSVCIIYIHTCICMCTCICVCA